MTNDYWVDDLEEIASRAAVHMQKGDIIQAGILLGEIKGILDQVLGGSVVTDVWDSVKKEYEQGTPPVVLSKRWGVTSKQIKQKAWKEHWLNPYRLAKLVKETAHRKYYYPKCGVCHREFEATYRSAVICSVCKALERRKWAEKKKDS